MAEFGRVDVLHNNAALTASSFLSRDTTVSEMSLDVWQRSLAVNLGSQLLMCKYAVPEMRKSRRRFDHQHVVGSGPIG